MRIKEEFKRSGYFWLPSASSEKVPGTLSISDGGNIELEVVGPLIAFGDYVKRIVGQIERDRFVTLDNCRCESREDSYGIKKSFIRVNRAFIGAKYDEGEIPRFDSLIFSIEGIDEWVGISGINVDYHFEEQHFNHIISAAREYSTPPWRRYAIVNYVSVGHLRDSRLSKRLG